MTEKTVDGQTTYYSYNPDGGLQIIKDHDQQVIAQYQYDPYGRRISKTLPQQNNQIIYFHYNDEGLIAEYDESGQLIQSYGYKPYSYFTTDAIFTHRPDISEELGYAFYIKDHLGTSKKLILKNGRTVWEASADAFGKTTIIKDEFRIPLRFSGQYQDDESGLRFNYFRFYDPTLSRYITSDPIGLNGGINTYAYVGGNPLNKIDPLGLTKLEFRVDEGRLIVDPEREGKKSYEIDVTSGRGECENKSSCEKKRNEGPIPRGKYYIDSRQIDDPTFWDDIQRNFFDERNQGGGDWGDWRARIYPYPGTKRFGRTGFYLHGGYLDGSAGCIDFGGGPFGNNRLLKDLRADPDHIIQIEVK